MSYKNDKNNLIKEYIINFYNQNNIRIGNNYNRCDIILK